MIGFRFGDEGCVVDVGLEGIRTRRREAEGCELIVSTSPISLASVVYDGRPVSEVEASGELKLSGDRALFDRFAGSDRDGLMVNRLRCPRR